MRKLITTTGGHPLQLDDITLLQTATIENNAAICEGLCANYSSTGVYLTGCIFINSGNPQSPLIQPYPSGTTVTAGSIYYNGETYPVDAQAVPVLPLGHSLYWQVQQQILAPSPVVYQDSGIHNVHIRERAVLVTGLVAPVNGFLAVSVLRLQQIIGTPQYTILPYYGSNTNFETTGEGKYGTSAYGFAKCEGQTVTLQTGGTFTTPNLKGRVLVGYDPAQTEFDGLTSNRPSETGGAKTHLLTAAESGLPAHTHTTASHSHSLTLSANNGSGSTTGSGGIALTNTGSSFNASGLGSADGNTVTVNSVSAASASTAHNNLQPYHNMFYIIKLY